MLATGSGFADGLYQFFDLPIRARLGHVITGAKLGRLDSGFRSGKCGHEDDRQMRFCLVQLLDQLKPLFLGPLAASDAPVQVCDDHVKIFFRRANQALLGLSGDLDHITDYLESGLEGLGDLLIVVNKQNPAHAASCTIGSTIPNAVPLPGSVVKRKAPPCLSMIFAEIGRPSPVPSSLVLKKGSKSRCCTSGGIPGPLSSTSMTMTSALRPFSSDVSLRARKVIFPSCSMLSAAFCTRLISTCLSCCGSAQNWVLGGVSKFSSIR